MEHSFWYNKWGLNQVGFHLDYVHPLLERNLGLFQVEGVLKKQGPVFIPLCGKTLDIGYLLNLGYQVIAIELSEIAVQAVFNQLNIEPEISDWSAGKIYQSESLRIYVGDFFALTQQDLCSAEEKISLVYDRAALIALPEGMRLEYAQHMAKITQYAPQLLITLDYDQSVAGGPPFAVTTSEVEALYGGAYPIQLIEEADIIEQEPRFKAKGLTSFYQRAYKLK
ncbi:MAG: thiopurine S-methyltransferase [Oleispira sp.]|nr:thiopurine S-methyltransferase [Oleispira sp.]